MFNLTEQLADSKRVLDFGDVTVRELVDELKARCNTVFVGATAIDDDGVDRCFRFMQGGLDSLLGMLERNRAELLADHIESNK